MFQSFFQIFYDTLPRSEYNSSFNILFNFRYKTLQLHIRTSTLHRSSSINSFLPPFFTNVNNHFQGRFHCICLKNWPSMHFGPLLKSSHNHDVLHFIDAQTGVNCCLHEHHFLPSNKAFIPVLYLLVQSLPVLMRFWQPCTLFVSFRFNDASCVASQTQTSTYRTLHHKLWAPQLQNQLQRWQWHCTNFIYVLFHIFPLLLLFLVSSFFPSFSNWSVNHISYSLFFGVQHSPCLKFCIQV